jgi:hypothetical protein
VTLCNEGSRPVPIKIEGIDYFTAADIHRTLKVARQTLWRWRKAGRIPQGRRFRDREIVFTQRELGEIREYANRLVPAVTASNAVKRSRSRVSGKRLGKARAHGKGRIAR